MMTSLSDQTTEINRKQKVFVLLLVLGGALIATSPFWYRPFTYQKKELSELRKFTNERESSVQKSIEGLREDYDNKKISDIQYITSLHSHLDKLKNVKKDNKKIISQKISSTKVFDWDSTYVFMIAFGTRIPILLFGLIFLFAFRYWNPKNPYLKISGITFSTLTIGTGIYWQVWVFWTSNDFPFGTHVTAIAISSLLASISLVSIILWRKLRIERLKDIIQYLNHLMIGVIPKTQPKKEAEYEEIVWDSIKYQADE